MCKKKRKDRFMKIDRCVCFDYLFAELKEVAYENNASTLHELQKVVVVGEACEMCVPYIEQMLQTGKTEFEP